MGLDTGFRCLWGGAHADIGVGDLANWSRDLDFDGGYFQGALAGQDAGNTGGAANHNHTDAGHEHLGNSHTHTISAASATGTLYSSGVSAGDSISLSQQTHSHGSSSSVATVITYNSGVATYTALEAHPPYYTLIVIKPDDANQEVPVGGIGFSDSGTPPPGFSVCDGSGGTPDLDGKFIRTANTGADAGGTGGATTHQHVAAAGHTHTSNSHVHAETDQAVASATVTATLLAGTTNARQRYHHHKSLSSKAGETTSSTSPSTVAASSLPEYRRLMPVQNESAAPRTSGDLILIWTGTRAALPVGWTLCDGTGGTQNMNGVQCYCTTTSGEIGDTGGEATHEHNISQHTHTHVPHDHTIGSERDTGAVEAESGADTALAKAAHNHTWTISSETPTIQNSSSSTEITSATDVRYLWRGVLFAKRVVATTVHIQGGDILGADIAA